MLPATGSRRPLNRPVRLTLGAVSDRSEVVSGRMRSRTIRPAPECVPGSRGVAEPVGVGDGELECPGAVEGVDGARTA